MIGRRTLSGSSFTLLLITPFCEATSKQIEEHLFPPFDSMMFTHVKFHVHTMFKHMYALTQSQFMYAVPSCTQLCSSSGYGTSRNTETDTRLSRIRGTRTGFDVVLLNRMAGHERAQRTNYAVLHALMTGISLRWIPTYKVSLSETECRVVKAPICSIHLIGKTADHCQTYFIWLMFPVLLHVLADYIVLGGNLEQIQEHLFPP